MVDTWTSHVAPVDLGNQVWLKMCRLTKRTCGWIKQVYATELLSQKYTRPLVCSSVYVEKHQVSVANFLTGFILVWKSQQYLNMIVYDASAILYCILLYRIVLHCSARNCIALHRILLHCIRLYNIVLYCIVLHCIALCCINQSRWRPFNQLTSLLSLQIPWR